MRKFFAKLGPGILLAGAAIGGSHLVASTQAGAKFGWALLTMLLLANLFKYPFFLYGQRYTAATGKTLIEAYKELGNSYLVMFFVLNVVNGIINIAGVSMITGSLATNFGLAGFSLTWLAGLIMGISILMIVAGNYKLLDSFGKYIIVILSISTIMALIFSLFGDYATKVNLNSESPWTITSFGFIIVFMGWMPAPIEASVWPSLWMKKKAEETGKMASMADSMLDFHVGYVVTILLAIVFLALGVILMHNSGEIFSDKGTIFAKQLIEVYTRALGDWAKPVIIISAFAAMFSTSITTIDGYPRVMHESSKIIFKRSMDQRKSDFVFKIWVIVISLIAFVLLYQFTDRLGDMLSLAMIISFLTAPLFAWMNYKIMLTDKSIDDEYRPRGIEKLLAVGGILFLSIFSLMFVYWYFFI